MGKCVQLIFNNKIYEFKDMEAFSNASVSEILQHLKQSVYSSPHNNREYNRLLQDYIIFSKNSMRSENIGEFVNDVEALGEEVFGNLSLSQLQAVLTNSDMMTSESSTVFNVLHRNNVDLNTNNVFFSNSDSEVNSSIIQTRNSVKLFYNINAKNNYQLPTLLWYIFLNHKINDVVDNYVKKILFSALTDLVKIGDNEAITLLNNKSEPISSKLSKVLNWVITPIHTSVQATNILKHLEENIQGYLLKQYNIANKYNPTLVYDETIEPLIQLLKPSISSQVVSLNHIPVDISEIRQFKYDFLEDGSGYVTLYSDEQLINIINSLELGDAINKLDFIPNHLHHRQILAKYPKILFALFNPIDNTKFNSYIQGETLNVLGYLEDLLSEENINIETSNNPKNLDTVFINFADITLNNVLSESPTSMWEVKSVKLFTDSDGLTIRTGDRYMFDNINRILTLPTTYRLKRISNSDINFLQNYVGNVHFSLNNKTSPELFSNIVRMLNYINNKTSYSIDGYIPEYNELLSTLTTLKTTLYLNQEQKILFQTNKDSINQFYKTNNAISAVFFDNYIKYRKENKVYLRRHLTNEVSREEAEQALITVNTLFTLEPFRENEFTNIDFYQTVQNEYITLINDLGFKVRDLESVLTSIAQNIISYPLIIPNKAIKSEDFNINMEIESGKVSGLIGDINYSNSFVSIGEKVYQIGTLQHLTIDNQSIEKMKDSTELILRNGKQYIVKGEIMFDGRDIVPYIYNESDAHLGYLNPTGLILPNEFQEVYIHPKTFRYVLLDFSKVYSLSKTHILNLFGEQLVDISAKTNYSLGYLIDSINSHNLSSFGYVPIEKTPVALTTAVPKFTNDELNDYIADLVDAYEEVQIIPAKELLKPNVSKFRSNLLMYYTVGKNLLFLSNHKAINKDLQINKLSPLVLRDLSITNPSMYNDLLYKTNFSSEILYPVYSLTAELTEDIQARKLNTLSIYLGDFMIGKPIPTILENSFKSIDINTIIKTLFTIPDEIIIDNLGVLRIEEALALGNNKFQNDIFTKKTNSREIKQEQQLYEAVANNVINKKCE